jgi:hypothetical protein
MNKMYYSFVLLFDTIVHCCSFVPCSKDVVLYLFAV